MNPKNAASEEIINRYERRRLAALLVIGTGIPATLATGIGIFYMLFGVGIWIYALLDPEFRQLNRTGR